TNKRKDKESRTEPHDNQVDDSPLEDSPRKGWLNKRFYEDELVRLQFELVKMQYWIKEKGERVVLIVEGRDAAGKGGLIQRIIEPLDPRGVRLVALSKPSDVEST